MIGGLGPVILTAARIEEKGKDLRKAAQGLESVFVHDLLRAMRRTTGQISTGASAMYTDMMDDAVSQKVAESGQFGIGKLLENQLMRAYVANGGH
jgi:Rod binding domain-containing protein